MSLTQLPVAQERAVYQNGVPVSSETANKRKESPMALDEPLEKRAKRESEDTHADSSSDCMCARTGIYVSLTGISQRTSRRTRTQNPRYHGP